MASLPNVPNYLKNVTKSIAFSALDVGKELMPDVSSFADSNKDFVKQTYTSVKTPRMTIRRIVGAFQNSKIYQSLDTGFKNFKEDITTGNFYNKEREDREIMKAMGFDFDFDDDSFNFDDGSFDESFGSDESNVTKGDLKIASTVEKSTAAAASANIKAIMNVGESSIKNARINTAMLFNQNERLFGGLHQDLSVVGATLTSLFDFHKSILGNIDSNISQFQTESLKLVNEQNAILKEMLELQRNQYKTAQEKEREAQKNSSNGRKRLSDINSIQDYIENVVSNAKNELSTYTMGFSLDSIASMFTGNVIRDLVKNVIRTSIPVITREAMSNFSQTFGSIFANAMMRLSDKSRGFGIFNTIAKILGVDTSVDRDVRTGKYERGQVAWDGISRRALINVIPGYLRRIESILSGKSEIDYNYEDGKWVTLKDVQKKFNDIKTNYANAATYDLVDAMMPTLKAKMPTNPKEKTSFKTAIAEFKMFLYTTNSFYPHEDAKTNGIDDKNYPNLYKYYKEFTDAYNDFDLVTEVDNAGNVTGVRHTKNGLRMGLAREVLNTREYENRRYRSMEADSQSSIIRLKEYTDKVKLDSAGKGISGMLDMKDKYGQTIHSYLHNINQELLFWRLNYGNTGFGNANGRGNGRRGRGNRRGNNGVGQIRSFDSLSDALMTQEQIEENRRIDEENRIREANDDQDYRKDILSRIMNNDIDDLSEFSRSTDAKEFLIELYRMDNEKLHSLFDELNAGEFNEEVINKFKDKQFTKAKIKDLKDLEKAIEEAQKSGKKTYEAIQSTGFFSGLLDRLSNGENIFSALLAKPAEMFNKVLYAADKSIYKMFFELKVKEDGTQYNGFFDMLVGEGKKAFTSLKDAITKNIIDPLKEKFGLTKDFKDRYVNELKSVGGSLWNKFATANREVIFNPIANRIKQRFNRGGQPPTTDQPEQPLTPADQSGQPQTPADQSGQPSMPTDQPEQPPTPSQNAKGTKPGMDFMGNTMLSEGEILANDSGVSVVQKTGAYNISKPTQILNSRDSYDLLNALGLKSPNKAKHSVRYDEAKENIEEKKLFKKHAEGTIDIKSFFNKRVPTEEEMKDIVEKAKANVPELAAGATIGAGASLIFGLVGGPLLGAAVGAGASLLKRSEGLQNILFGEVGEDGERKDNGLISKKVQELYKKYIPTLSKYGAAGLVASIVTPLGPIGGALIGAGIGVLKENEDLREKLFGKLHIGDKEKEVIKKMLPNTLKGAGAGIIATFFGGPFGLVGNAAVGAAIGMMTSTDGFKNGLLGEMVNGVRSGGVLGAIKDAFQPLADAGNEFKDKIFNAIDDNIVKPLSEFIQPAIHALPQLASFIPRKINELLEDKFGLSMQTILKHLLVTPIKTLMKPVAKVAGTAFKAVTMPFRMLGKVGEGIRKQQMRTMNADYMTADERMAWAADHGMQISESDKFFGSIGSKEFTVDQAKDLRSTLSSMIDSQDSLSKARKDKNKEINKILDDYKANGHSLSHKAKKEIAKALNSGHPEKISEILQENALEDSDVGLNADQVKALMEGQGLRKMTNEYMDLDTRWRRAKNLSEKDRKAAKEKSDDILESVGLAGKVNLSKRHDIEKFIKYLDTEIDAKTPTEDEEEHNILTENHENIKTITTTLKGIAAAMGVLEEEGDDTTKRKAIARQKRTANAVEDSVARSVAYQDIVINAVGEENWAEMPEEQKELARGYSGPNHKPWDPRSILDMRRSKRMPKSTNRLRELYNIKSGISKRKLLFDDAAKNYIANNLSDENYKRLKKFLNNNYINEIIVSKDGYRITVKDIQYYLSLVSKINYVENRCQNVIEANAQNRYNSIQSIMAMSGADLAVLQNSRDAVYDASFEDGNPPQQDSQPDQSAPPEHHFLGTILGGALSLGKKVVNGVTSLFRGEDKESSGGGALQKIGGSISSLFNSVGQGMSNAGVGSGEAATTTVNDEKIDKPDDGRFLGAIGHGFGWFKKKTDGSVEPDTADSSTKTLVTMRDKKQEILDKLQNAQMAASNALKDAFSGETKGKVKKGMGWLGALLIGGALWKTGLIQGLFNNFLKPLWTKWIKPKIISPAWKWIKETALPKVGEFITGAIGGLGDLVTTVVGGIGDLLSDSKLPEKIGEIFGKLLTTFAENLPAILKGTFKGAIGLTTGLINGVTGNKTNEGGRTDINTKDAEGNERTGMSQMKDANGNDIPWDEIKERVASGNVEGIYNAEGVEANIKEDTFGNKSIGFDDQSPVGSSYAKTMANGMWHAYVNPTMGKFAGKALIKGGNAVSKVVKHVPLIGRSLSISSKLAGNVLGRPLTAAAKFGERTNSGGNIIRRSINKYSGAAPMDPVKSAAGLIEQNAAKSAAKEGTEAATKQLALKGASEAAEDLTVNVAESAIATGAKKAGSAAAEGAAKSKGLISRILNWAKTKISDFLSSPKVVEKLQKIASFLKLDKAGKAGNFVKEVSGNISKTFDDIMAKAAKKVGSETLQKVAAKANLILGIATTVADFITGMDQAEAILGVEETNIIDEVIAGIINALCNLLIFPTIWPGVPKVAQFIYKIFSKWTGGDYEKRVAKADAAYEEWKAQTGSTKTKEEWLKSTKSVTGWVEDKVGGVIGGAWNGIKKAGSAVWGGIKKVGKAAVSGVKAIGGGIKSTFKKIGETATNRFNKVKNAGKAALNFGKKLLGFGSNEYNAKDFEWKYTAELNDKDFMSSVYNPMSQNDIAALATKAQDSDPESLEILTRACLLTNTDVRTGTALDQQAIKIMKETYDKVVLNKKPQTVGSVITNLLTGKITANTIANATKSMHNAFKKSKIGSFILKSTPLGGVLSTVNKVAQSFIGNKDKSKKTDSIIDDVMNNKISLDSTKYWSGIKNDDGTLNGALEAASTGLTRIISLPILLVKKALQSIANFAENPSIWSEKIGKIVDLVTDPVGYIYNTLSNDKSTVENRYIKQDGKYASTNESATTNTANLSSNPTAVANTPSVNNTTSSKSTSWLSTIAMGGLKAIGSIFGFGRGPEYSKQIDPRIAGIRYNSNKDSEYQTIGDSGCGPAAAVNMVESMYGRGPESVVNAAKFALSRGYKETDGGTRPEFFNDYLATNGINSDTTYSKSQIAQRLNSGIPTILMGQDPNGVSSSTPFGAMPHYVTVTGLDGNGRAIVQDPESYYDNQVYDIKDLVRTSSIGISASGLGKYGRANSYDVVGASDLQLPLATDNTTTSNKSSKNTKTKSKKMVIVGDDRAVGIYNANITYHTLALPTVNSLIGKTDFLGNIWCAKNGAEYHWITSGIEGISEYKIGSDFTVICIMGVNDTEYPYESSSKYAAEINKQAKALNKKNIKIYVIPCLPVSSKAKSSTIKNASKANVAINNFNKNLKSNLSSSVKWYDLNSELKGKLTYTSDGINFDSKSYKLIYDTIYNNIICPSVVTKGVAGAVDTTKIATNAANAIKTATNTASNIVKNVSSTSDTISNALDSNSNEISNSSNLTNSDYENYPLFKFENGILMIRTKVPNTVENTSSNTTNNNSNDGTTTTSSGEGTHSKIKGGLGKFGHKKFGKGYEYRPIGSLLNSAISNSPTAKVLNSILDTSDGPSNTTSDTNTTNETVNTDYTNTTNETVNTDYTKYEDYSSVLNAPAGTNSSLVGYVKRVKHHSGKRTHKIDRITPHCVVGQVTAKRLGEIFSGSRKVSSNYGIAKDGTIGLYVDECNRSWCSSSNANDQRAVTIECASDSKPPYAFNQTVYKTLIKLCIDICKRNGKKKLLWLGSKSKTLNYNPKSDEMVLTVHRWFANKSCPGDWMYNRMGELANRVTAALSGTTGKGGNGYKIPSKYGRAKFGMGNEATIWNWLKAKGYSDAATAGIMGNMYAESGFRPDAVGDSGTSFGLCQWHKGRGERMKETAGKNWKTNIAGQLTYLDKELSTGNGVIWSKASTYKSFKSFKSATNAKQAAIDFEKAFERAKNPNFNKRMNAAAKYYNQFSGKVATSTDDATSSSTSTAVSRSTGNLFQISSNTAAGIRYLPIGGWLNSVLFNTPVAKILNSILNTSNDSSGDSNSNTTGVDTTNNEYINIPAGTTQALKLVEVAKSQIGEKESPAGSNKVKYVDWYTGKQGSSIAWCCIFVSWCADKAEIPKSIIPKEASCESMVDKLKQLGGKVIDKNSVAPGDIMFVKSSTSGYSHAGIVCTSSNGKIECIEGNTGNGVVKKNNRSSGNLLFIRPAYTDSGTGTKFGVGTIKKPKSKFIYNQLPSGKGKIAAATPYKNTASIYNNLNSGKGGNNKPVSKYGQFKNAIYGTNTNKNIDYLAFSKNNKEDHITNIESPISNISEWNTNKSILESGKGTTPTIMQQTPVISSDLAKSIIELLFKIANNTDTLNVMLTLLKEKFNIKISPEDIANAQYGNSTSEKLAAAIANSNSSALSKLNTYADSIENSTMASLINSMNIIASE